MFIINLLIIIGIEDIIDLMSLYYCFKFGNRKYYPCINLTGIHNYRSVEMSECISGLQIIETKKCTNLSSVIL